MNRYIRLAIVGAVFTGISAGAAYEGTRYGYDTGKAQGIAQGEQKGKAEGMKQGRAEGVAEISEYVTKTCESGDSVRLTMGDRSYYCLTENQLVGLIQAISEKAIEEYRKQGGYHGQKKVIPSL
jgi:flagellar biosynthesis/type III secretory pathway protein FliH